MAVFDRNTGQIEPIDPRDYLSNRQFEQMCRQPDLLLQFCRYLGRNFDRLGHPGVEVHAQVVCSMNGRRPQLLVNPAVDLTSQPRGLAHQTWIIPLHEPLSESLWEDPPRKWPSSLIWTDPRIVPVAIRFQIKHQRLPDRFDLAFHLGKLALEESDFKKAAQCFDEIPRNHRLYGPSARRWQAEARMRADQAAAVDKPVADVSAVP